MVIYRTLYDEQVSDIPYDAISNAGISESEWTTAQGWADDVAIVAVPLPGSFVLMLAEMGGVILPLWRRRKSTR